jgi:hypothetical protein
VTATANYHIGEFADRALTITGGTRPADLLVLGGAPLGEPIAGLGPFVMNTPPSSPTPLTTGGRVWVLGPATSTAEGMPTTAVARPPGTPRRLLWAAAVAVAAVTLAGCQPASYVGRPDAPRVAVVGDSLVWAAQPQITTNLPARRWAVLADGVPGATAGDRVAVAGGYAAGRPRAVVVALGTNDVLAMAEGRQSWEGFRRDVRAMLAATRGVGCVVWVGGSDTSGDFGPGHNLAQMGWAVNWMLAEELARSGRPPGATLLADWAAVSRRADYYLGPGDVHHSEAGKAAYTQLIADTVGRCGGAPMRGNVDAAQVGVGQVTVAGWAFDPDAPRDPVRVHVYVNGAYAADLEASGNRPDVQRAYPLAGAAHGYVGTVPAPAGRADVCVYAIETRGPQAANPLLACRRVVVQAPTPTGSSADPAPAAADASQGS